MYEIGSARRENIGAKSAEVGSDWKSIISTIDVCTKRRCQIYNFYVFVVILAGVVENKFAYCVVYFFVVKCNYMDKQPKDTVWQMRLSLAEKLKIVFLAKLLRVKQSEAVRQAVDKMLKEKQGK